ncbi:winged helix-turn-helix domain-containing protein [Haloarcula rubripromontorii]|uniref:winged helix-turn-helix domain-containing protein n=1 Tax=Haloarcula rubripromontorii TaxID=1705562 RepID=UPI00345BA263
MTEKQNTRKEVLEVLREGRATPRYIREQTTINSKQNAQHHLQKLRADGRVEKVSRGLYELVEDPRSDAYRESMGTIFAAAMEEISDEPSVDIDRDEFEFAENGGGSE